MGVGGVSLNHFFLELQTPSNKWLTPGKKPRAPGVTRGIPGYKCSLWESGWAFPSILTHSF
jgi:hypothetical protein